MGGIPLETSEVDERGLRRDRRWMLVDKEDVFISQRELPRMALIGAEIRLDALIMVALGMPSLHVPFDLLHAKLIRARIWDDVVQALPVGDDADPGSASFSA
jgi:uncharacterized protein